MLGWVRSYPGSPSLISFIVLGLLFCIAALLAAERAGFEENRVPGDGLTHWAAIVVATTNVGLWVLTLVASSVL